MNGRSDIPRVAHWSTWMSVALVMSSAQGVVGQSTFEQVPTDWDLHMIRLINRARADPTGEDLLRGTNYGESQAPPLAYSPLLGRAAQNHTEWLGANRHNPLLETAGQTEHHETLDGSPGGPTGEHDTIGWSGDRIGDRARFVGYSFRGLAENVLRRSRPQPIDAPLIESNHASWWSSSGHRRAMMDPDYAAFGHHVMNDEDGPNRKQWSTEMFARPGSALPSTHLFGVLYWDTDGSGDWTPRDVSHPLREGLGGVPIHVLSRGNVVATGETMDNGAYTINIQSAVFDIVFGYDLRIDDVRLGDMNLDLGDLAVIPQPGDANRDLLFSQADIVRVLNGGKYLSGESATWGDGDWTDDGLFNQTDLVAAAQTDLYLKAFEAPDTNPPGAVFFEDFEDTFGFKVSGHARVWGVAPLSGTASYPSQFEPGGSQSGNVFYGVNGWDSTATMTIDLPDLSDYEDLQLTVALAAPDGGRWESTHRDSLIIDGTSETIDRFLPRRRSAPLTSQVHSTDLHYEFQDFTYSIDSSLESLTFRFASTSDDEMIGIDSVTITGIPWTSPRISVPEPRTMAHAVLGLLAVLVHSRRRNRLLT